MKFATFDIEIVKELAEHIDWKSQLPLGISCAAIRLSDKETPEFFQSPTGLSQIETQDLVTKLLTLQDEGYTIVTWNGCGFDFNVLAYECGLDNEYDWKNFVNLTLNHIDMMLLVAFQKGHYLGLNKACIGAHLEGKKHEVTLKSGEVLTEMGGAKAPQLWKQGEYDAVLTYLAEDVNQLLYLTQWVEEKKMIQWLSGSARWQSVPVPKLYTVKECFGLPKPDTSWMTNPPTRSQFIEWIPPEFRTDLPE